MRETLVLVSQSRRKNLPDSRELSKAIEFIERKYQALERERGPSWVAAKDFVSDFLLGPYQELDKSL